MGRFERFRFPVPAVPLQKGFLSVFPVQFTGKDGSGSGFGSAGKTVPAVPVPLSVSEKNGSGGSGFPFRFGSSLENSEKKSGKGFPGPSRPRGRKSSKTSRNSSDYFSSVFFRLFGLFFRLFF